MKSGLSPVLTSQKYKGNLVDVLWISSTATVQLTCYRKLCEGCCWPVWNLHTEHTQLSQLNDSSAPAQQVLWNFPPSSLTVKCSPQLPHGSKFSFSSSKTPHNQHLWYFHQLTVCSSLLAINELFLLLPQIHTSSLQKSLFLQTTALFFTWTRTFPAPTRS